MPDDVIEQSEADLLRESMNAARDDVAAAVGILQRERSRYKPASEPDHVRRSLVCLERAQGMLSPTAIVLAPPVCESDDDALDFGQSLEANQHECPSKK